MFAKVVQGQVVPSRQRFVALTGDVIDHGEPILVCGIGQDSRAVGGLKQDKGVRVQHEGACWVLVLVSID